jgi:CRP-like cAMP-binding protein
MARPKFWYLRRLHVDERLPDDVREALGANARLERWGHQADIFRGPADSGVSIILKGRVWLRDYERAREIALLRGDIFGRADFEVDPANLSLRAHDDTLIAVLDREEFAEMIVPHLGRLSTRVGLFRKRRDLWVPVQPLLFTTPTVRLAKVLLHLVETEGALDERGHGELAMRLEARSLAELTGVDPVRVRNVLKALERQKILERGRSGTRIWDLDTLRQVALEG